MGLFNTSKAMLDAIKGVVTDDRKQYVEEQQQMDRLVAEKILSPKQKKIAAVAGDKDKIDAADFAALRSGKKVAEAKDTVTKDASGKVTSWSSEGDWKPVTGKDPRGKVTNLSDKARRKTEKMTNEEDEYMDEGAIAKPQKDLKKHSATALNMKQSERKDYESLAKEADDISNDAMKYGWSGKHQRAAKVHAELAKHPAATSDEIKYHKSEHKSHTLEAEDAKGKPLKFDEGKEAAERNESILEDLGVLESILDDLPDEDLDEASIVGQAKHLVKGIKRMAAGKPSAGASEKDADTKARQRYSDSKVHSRAAADAAFDFKSPNKRVYANRLSAANYNIKKGDHQSRRADKIAALRDKVANEAVERDTPGNSTHQCAVHVKHSTFGEGKALYSQHANPDHNGNIEWYDIMFEHGIEKQVPISDLEVIEEMSHGNHKKGKK